MVRDELLARIITDHRWAIETFLDLIHRDIKRGIQPFIFTHAQDKYHREIMVPGIRKVVVGKCRKLPGFSTLELADGLIETLTTPGLRYGVFAHKQETANNLNRTIKLLYESFCRNLRKSGEDPHDYIPGPTNDNVMGYDFGEINSGIFVGTASGRGVGQSDRFDRVYATEYSDWECAEQARAGLEGSQPPGARFIIDFNAHGTSNDAYTMYQNAKLSHTDPDWNGYTAFFAGVLDCPDICPPEFLEEKRRSLKKRFPEVYPSNDVEMFLASELAVFEAEHIEAACDRMQGKYFGEGCERYVHGVDTATGRPDGDFQVCVTLGRRDGLWGEAAPAIRERVAEDVFADMVHERVSKFGGSCVVERNVGSVVLGRLRDRGTAGLYRHRYRDRDGSTKYELGYPTTGGASGTKKLMISDMQRALRDGEIGLVTPELVQEMREYEWKLRDDGRDDRTMAGAPDRAGSHDDAAMAAMLALQGANEVEARVWV